MIPIRNSYKYSLCNGVLKMRIHWNSFRLQISTGYHVNPDAFDGSRCLPNTSHGKTMTPAAVINTALADLEKKLGEAFLNFAMSNTIPSKEDLKNALCIAGGSRAFSSPDSRHPLEPTFNQFVIERSESQQWAVNTIRNVRNIGKLLMVFDRDIDISRINADWLARFVDFQKNHKRRRSADGLENRGYSNPVIKRNMELLRWFLDWAASKKILSREAYKDFKPRLKQLPRPVIFLRWEELMRVYSLDLSADIRLQTARDIFCLCSFTSLRYSDAMGLLKSQVKRDYLEVVAVKTGKRLEIDLNRYSRAILERYRSSEGPYAMPRMSAQLVDYHLKTIGRLAGIDEPVTQSQYYGGRIICRTDPKYARLSSHCGRRTFICNALALGISPIVVMKWTGHSEFAAMKPYIDVADDIRRSAMSLFDSAAGPGGFSKGKV